MKRTISLVDTYLNISLQHYEESKMKREEYYRLLQDTTSWVMGKDRDILLKDLFNQESNARIISLTFYTMAIEAYIYDYAVTNLSRNYVKTYLDKLDLKSKWVIIPKLVTGKNFPTDKNGLQLLNKLISIRNKLVHSKSVEVDYESMTIEEYTTLYESVSPNLESCIDELLTTFDELKKDLATIS